MKQIRKALLLFSLVAACLASSGQQNLQPVNGFGFDYQALGARVVLLLPNRCDTAFTTAYRAILRPGAMFWNNCSNQRWVFFNDHWQIDVQGGSVGGSGTSFSLRGITSPAFSTATNCPLPALNGDSLQVFWNDVGRYLTQGTEWQNLAGGGFTILVPGFNATTNAYSFDVYASGTGKPVPQVFTSAAFSSATICPIAAFNAMTLSIYWNDANRYLIPVTEWTALAGGGFTVTIPGFDATTNNYSFYIFAQ